MKKTALLLSATLSLFCAARALAANDGSCSTNDPGALSALSDASAAASFSANDAQPPASAIVFRADDGNWTENVEAASGGPGAIFAGANLRLVSSASRFPNCGNGNVTAFVRTSDGNVTSIPLDSGDRMLNRSANFRVPAGTDGLDVWFHAVGYDRWGNQSCEEWDSNFGSNYHFDVKTFAPVAVHFAADGSAPSADRALPRGGAMVIDYDPARIPGCRSSYMGHDTWNVVAHAKFDNGAVMSSNVVAHVGDTGSGPAVFAIPDDATSAQVWFEADGYYPGSPTCTAFDSNGGANYSFDVR
ncbi:MAG TPA: DUF6209 family protein [bacterium]|nr:DUF6209 family protein [bacterium]